MMYSGVPKEDVAETGTASNMHSRQPKGTPPRVDTRANGNMSKCAALRRNLFVFNAEVACFFVLMNASGQGRWLILRRGPM